MTYFRPIWDRLRSSLASGEAKNGARACNWIGGNVLGSGFLGTLPSTPASKTYWQVKTSSWRFVAVPLDSAHDAGLGRIHILHSCLSRRSSSVLLCISVALHHLTNGLVCISCCICFWQFWPTSNIFDFCVNPEVKIASSTAPWQQGHELLLSFSWASWVHMDRKSMGTCTHGCRRRCTYINAGSWVKNCGERFRFAQESQ